MRSGRLVVLVLPALLMFLLFAFLPMIGVLVLSFTSWDGISPISFTGLASWRQVLSDPGTYHSLYLTFGVMICSWVVQTPISLLLGTFVAGRQRYRAALAVLFFLPLLFSSAAVAIAFKSLLDPYFGLAAGLHLDVLAQDWLGDPELAFGVVIFVIAWQFIPFHTLIYQGGVRQIPEQLYEAAQIDGAGRVRQFFSITVPQLKYTIITSSTLMLVGSLTYFDLIFVLTQGGPGEATRILALDMYITGFQANQMGAASVIGVSPIQATIIPVYLMIIRLHMYDSLGALILPSIAFGIPLTVLILSNFLRDVPRELFESMKLDGCSDWQMAWRLAFPLTRPAIVTVAIYNGLNVWNGFLFPLILTQSPDKRVMPLALWAFQGQYSTNVPAVLAAVVLSTLPILILYVVGRRQLLSGLTAGFGK